MNEFSLVAYDLTGDRFHPIFFRQAARSGEPLSDRYRSSEHHACGFASMEDAVRHAGASGCALGEGAIVQSHVLPVLEAKLLGRIAFTLVSSWGGTKPIETRDLDLGQASGLVALDDLESFRAAPKFLTLVGRNLRDGLYHPMVFGLSETFGGGQGRYVLEKLERSPLPNVQAAVELVTTCLEGLFSDATILRDHVLRIDGFGLLKDMTGDVSGLAPNKAFQGANVTRAALKGGEILALEPVDAPQLPNPADRRKSAGVAHPPKL